MGPVMRPPPRPFSANAEPDIGSPEPDAVEREAMAVRLPRHAARPGAGWVFVAPLALLGMRDLEERHGLAPAQAEAARSRARACLLLRVAASGPDRGGE